MSKAYIDELKSLGVNVDEEIPLFVIPIEDEFIEESTNAQQKDAASSLKTASGLIAMVIVLVTTSLID